MKRTVSKEPSLSSTRAVHVEDKAKEVCRIDLSKEAPRAVHVRIRRKPGAADGFFALDKFLVYGRKLY